MGSFLQKMECKDWEIDMKILWLTIDRTNRVASHIFAGLQQAVRQLVHVDFVIRKPDTVAGTFCRQVVMQGRKLPSMINLDTVNDYDLVFTDAIFGFMSERWKDIKIPKAILIEDQHGPMVRRYVEQAHNNFKFNIFCMRYKNATKKFHPYLNNHSIIWLPHSIPWEVFRDYGRQKPIGCLSTGINNSKVYPIRAKIDKELKNASFYKRIERPSERMPGKGRAWPSGIDYARLLNECKIAVGCTSRFGYPVMKLFEIPACATALCSDFIPELGELGFVPGKNMIEIKHTDNSKILIKKWLASSQLEQITRNGYSLILERHTTEIRAKEFIASMKKYI